MKAFFVYKFSKRASKKCNSSKIIKKCAINVMLDVSTCSIQERTTTVDTRKCTHVIQCKCM